jgi:hydrogenase expression/formation protein HypD
VQGFLLAGHVCSVMGFHEYPALLEQFRIPMAVTGFEPLDLVQGILELVRLLEAGRLEIVNAYRRGVTFEGNRPAQDTIHAVFEECDRKWRGIGVIPGSGWQLKPEFNAFNAELKFNVGQIRSEESPLCISGQILQIEEELPAFRTACTEHRLLCDGFEALRHTTATDTLQ